MTKVNKVNDEMELYIDPIGLIEAVKERTVLYTLTRNASLRAKRNRAWSEVAKQIIPNWSGLSKTEQDLCEAELQKKWNNLKDSYIKAYKKEVLASAAGAKKHKQYVYFEALSFLKPDIMNKTLSVQKFTKIERIDNIDIDTNDNNQSSDDQVEYLEDTKKSTKNSIKISTPKILQVHGSDAKDLNAQKSFKDTGSKKLKLQECISDLVSTMNNERSYDTDDMFLLSLNPYLKQLNERKKIETQIEILTLIKQRTLDQEYE